MKIPLLTSVSLGLALAALPIVGGCSQQNATSSPSFLSSANAEPAPADPSPPALAASADITATVTSSASAPQPAPAAEPKLPANINPSTSAGQVIKLAQAGVDETVMLTYITNSASLFTLGSDEIIYLNDLGVPSNVVTAMLNHDQSVKAYWSNNAKAQASDAPVQAAPPTYVNPQQPEPQPAPVDAAPAPTAQPANVTHNYFNDSLSPYGTWIEVEGYGRCWQPTVVVVNRGWQPYGDRGRWVYSDAGWYWLSDYSWGATTFHYGRWFNHARWGWCWWPDSVWAPSWVSWRYSGDYCGWAPLPPRACYRNGFGFSYYDRSVGFGFDFGLGASCYTFVPWGRFCDSRPHHYRVPSHQVTQIYNNTTIINNYGSGNNNTVINHGIPLDRVREYTHADLRPVKLRETAGTPGRGMRSERLDHDGRTLIVNRPHLSPSTQPSPSIPPRPHVDNAPVNDTAGGAGTAAITETSRGHLRDRNADQARERGSRPATAGTTVIGAPAQNRNLTPTATTTVTAPSANSTRPDNRATPRQRDERPDNSNRDRKRDNGQNSTTPPLIVNGFENRNASSTVAPPAPKGSLVVIGRRNDNQSSPGRVNQTWSVPTPATQPAQVASAATSPSYNPPAPMSPQAERRETQRFTPQENRYASPAYSAPRSAPAPTPSYTAPRQPSYSPPAPTYNAARSAPAPSYTPPPAPRPQNVESRPAPARSQSNRDGDRGNGRNR